MYHSKWGFRHFAHKKPVVILEDKSEEGYLKKYVDSNCKWLLETLFTLPFFVLVGRDEKCLACGAAGYV